MVGRVAEVRTRLQCNLNLPLHRGFESRTIRIGNNSRKPGTQKRTGESFMDHHGEVAGNCAENLHSETNT